MNKIKPAVWIPKERPERDLIDVLYEAEPSYVIFWYHWPMDGYALVNPHADYEPVILVVSRKEVVGVAARPHNRYVHSSEWFEHQGRPVIVFRTPWHEPVIFSGQPTAKIFAKKRFSRWLADYPIVRGHPPQWFIKADSGISVYDYAQALASGSVG